MELNKYLGCLELPSRQNFLEKMTISDEDDILLEDFDDQEMMDIDLDVKPIPMAQKAKVAGIDLGAGPATASKVESSLDLDMLKDYYHRSFPSELMYQFLQSNFSYREFSFTLAGDIYVRFKSFNTLAEFKQDLVKSRPIKIGNVDLMRYWRSLRYKA